MASSIIAASIMAGATLASTATSVTSSAIESHKARKTQREAQEKALEAQQEADNKAETARLEALAKDQQGQAGFDFGIDSALAKRYADAAQKWSAGTGSMTTDDDNENPFYTRGLI